MDKLREKIAAVGLVPFAQSIGVRYQSVQGWLKAGRVPPRRAVLIERKYGISRADLCPDVFGPAPEQQAAPLLKTSNAERVTCPRCLKKMKAAAKKVAP